MARLKAIPGAIPSVPFEEYRRKYEKFFMLERNESGVLMARWHTNGDTLTWDLTIHKAIHQMLADAGADPENEVFILTGTGDKWIGDIASAIGGAEAELENQDWLSYEMFYDGSNICEGLINDLEIPSIGAINGPGYHTEMALMCDITICTEDTVIIDPHYKAGLVPGDGIQIAFREAMGTKRANYAMLMGEAIDAEKALSYGMVSEIVPKSKIYERAWEIGEQLAKQKRTTRRLTTQVLRAPWKRALAQELTFGFMTEAAAYLADRATHRADLHDEVITKTTKTALSKKKNK